MNARRFGDIFKYLLRHTSSVRMLQLIGAPVYHFKDIYIDCNSMYRTVVESLDKKASVVLLKATKSIISGSHVAVV